MPESELQLHVQVDGDDHQHCCPPAGRQYAAPARSGDEGADQPSRQLDLVLPPSGGVTPALAFAAPFPGFLRYDGPLPPRLLAPL